LTPSRDFSILARADNMIVQIYTMQSAEEALAVIDAGADHVGITPSSLGLPGEVTCETAREIAHTVRYRRAGKAFVVALSVETTPEPIEEMVRLVQPDILQLCGPGELPSPADISRLRSRIPGVRIMQAISVDGPDAIRRAAGFAPVVDLIILDTQDPHIPGIGASGAVHDWSVSRRIVETAGVPVILAGGLSPENVGEAVRTVQPWGVDSLTHTNRPHPDGGFRKDIERIRLFAGAARAEAERIGNSGMAEPESGTTASETTPRRESPSE
jgi:phosphoribosylanthranilate isomerase